MVDKPRTTLSDGTQVYPEHRNLKPNGQQEGYIVLAEEERAKGFVRPVRRIYVHKDRDYCAKHRETGLTDCYDFCTKRKGHAGECGDWRTMTDRAAGVYRVPCCGTATTMGQTLAETYARDPYFYSGTFCCGCGTHFPVGPEGEFVWDGTSAKVGT
jgi:hypothetical protein